jgi:hypothetical protein
MSEADTSYQEQIGRFRWFTYALARGDGGVGFDERFHVTDAWLPRIADSDLPEGRVPHTSVSLDANGTAFEGTMQGLYASGASFVEFTAPAGVDGDLVLDITDAQGSTRASAASADLQADPGTSPLRSEVTQIPLNDGVGSLTIHLDSDNPSAVLQAVSIHDPDDDALGLGYQLGWLDWHAEFVPTGAVASDGTVDIGVSRFGDLIDEGIGLRFADNPDSDVLSNGCWCENWGIGLPGTSDAAGTSTAGDATGIADAELTASDGHVTSAVTFTGGLSDYRMIQDVHPSSVPGLMQMDVTVQNQTIDTLPALSYRRSVDWDMPPTQFDESVSWQQVSSGAPFVRFTSDDGFGSTDLAQQPTWLTDSGWFGFQDGCDRGSQLEVQLDSIGAFGSTGFTLYYGLADDEASAEDAVAAVGAQAYSLAIAAGEASGARPVAILAVDGSDLPAATPPQMYGHPSTEHQC